jgi:hypothetical protein
MRQPSEILIQDDGGKYPEIVDFKFKDDVVPF